MSICLVKLVLVKLPLTELLLSHSLVCRTWRESFLPHRKSYCQYKLGRVSARDKLVKEQVELVVD